MVLCTRGFRVARTAGGGGCLAGGCDGDGAGNGENGQRLDMIVSYCGPAQGETENLVLWRMAPRWYRCRQKKPHQGMLGYLAKAQMRSSSRPGGVERKSEPKHKENGQRRKTIIRFKLRLIADSAWPCESHTEAGDGRTVERKQRRRGDVLGQLTRRE